MFPKPVTLITAADFWMEVACEQAYKLCTNYGEPNEPRENAEASGEAARGGTSVNSHIPPNPWRACPQPRNWNAEVDKHWCDHHLKFKPQSLKSGRKFNRYNCFRFLVVGAIHISKQKVWPFNNITTLHNFNIYIAQNTWVYDLMRFTLQCKEQCFRFSFVFCFKLL